MTFGGLALALALLAAGIIISLSERGKQVWKGRIIGKCLLCDKPIYDHQGHHYFDQRNNKAWLKKNEVPEDKADKLEVHDKCAYAHCLAHEMYWF